MVVTAGFWGAVERNLSRMVGFAVILDIGFSLLALSLVSGDDTGLYRNLFFAGLIVRGLSLGVLALSMSVLIDRIETFEIVNLRGLGKRMPVIAISLIAGLLSLAGAPVFAGFPFKLGTVEGVSAQSPAVSVWILLGTFGLVIGTIRVLLSLVSDENEEQESAPGPRLVIFYLLIGVGVIFLIGLLPNYFLQFFTSLPAVFGGQ
jgi:NADH-quinone oxidoreductase subunit N